MKIYWHKQKQVIPMAEGPQTGCIPGRRLNKWRAFQRLLGSVHGDRLIRSVCGIEKRHFS